MHWHLQSLLDHSKSIIEWHLRTLAQNNLLAFGLTFFLTFYPTFLSLILSDILNWLSDILSSILFDIFVAAEALRSRAGRGGPARWRSGEAHCDQELAEEVRRGPLRSRAGRGGPARPTAIKSWQMRSGEGEEEEGRKEGRGGGGQADIKSNNPHLAGGENSLGIGTLILAIFRTTLTTQQRRGWSSITELFGCSIANAQSKQTRRHTRSAVLEAHQNQQQVSKLKHVTSIKWFTVFGCQHPYSTPWSLQPFCCLEEHSKSSSDRMVPEYHEQLWLCWLCSMSSRQHQEAPIRIHGCPPRSSKWPAWAAQCRRC